MGAIAIIAGALAVIYLIIVIIKKSKNPGQGEKRVNAEVVSIFKLRVPVQATGDRNRLASGNMVIPTANFQMVFRELNRDETHTFSVKADTVQKWHEKDQGVLTYKGDEFVAFEIR